VFAREGLVDDLEMALAVGELQRDHECPEGGILNAKAKVLKRVCIEYFVWISISVLYPGCLGDVLLTVLQKRLHNFRGNLIGERFSDPVIGEQSELISAAHDSELVDELFWNI
jgi:hypothetical protein